MRQNLLFFAVVVAMTGAITAAFSLQNNQSLDLLRSPPQSVELQPVQVDPFGDALPTSEGITPSAEDYTTTDPGIIPPAPAPSVAPSPVVTPVAPPAPVARSTPSYQPPQYQAQVHPSNYGDRYAKDAAGRPANNDWIIVLHETVGSGTSAINHFQTPHPDDADQASYHALIWADGTVIYLVPPEKRAYGAGNSVFEGDRGIETVKTNPNLPPSVNNFAYHISLETPPDGRQSKESTHSGYTQAQYQSLAWLVARTGVPSNRITTHRAVDRSGTRGDPRSFDTTTFESMLNLYR